MSFVLESSRPPDSLTRLAVSNVGRSYTALAVSAVFRTVAQRDHVTRTVSPVCDRLGGWRRRSR